MSDRASYFKFLFDKAKNIEGVVQGMDAVKFFQKSGLPMVSSCLRLGDSEGYLEFIELQKVGLPNAGRVRACSQVHHSRSKRYSLPLTVGFQAN